MAMDVKPTGSTLSVIWSWLFKQKASPAGEAVGLIKSQQGLEFP